MFYKHLLICEQLGALSQTWVALVPIAEFTGLFLGNVSTLILDKAEDLAVYKLEGVFLLFKLYLSLREARMSVAKRRRRSNDIL